MGKPDAEIPSAISSEPQERPRKVVGVEDFPGVALLRGAGMRRAVFARPQARTLSPSTGGRRFGSHARAGGRIAHGRWHQLEVTQMAEQGVRMFEGVKLHARPAAAVLVQQRARQQVRESTWPTGL
jgi:hypothetical protein